MGGHDIASKANEKVEAEQTEEMDTMAQYLWPGVKTLTQRTFEPWMCRIAKAAVITLASRLSRKCQVSGQKVVER